MKLKVVYYDLNNQLAVENLNVEKINNHVKIKNIPFFAPNLAYDDIVSFEVDDNEYFFDDIIERSGNSTIQVIFFNKSIIKHFVNQISELGCGWEGSHVEEYISINVPSNINYKKIKELLNIEMSNNNLDYKESSLSHVL